ncbi:MAG: hypothetical protein HRU78_07970 [Gammaproteobacteria bacterium]|nr:MAG: hypothetical protein HRU78_07970 [Gammaproteobacteria bacterium]
MGADQIDKHLVNPSLVGNRYPTKQNLDDNFAMRRQVEETGRYLKLEVLLNGMNS